MDIEELREKLKGYYESMDLPEKLDIQRIANMDESLLYYHLAYFNIFFLYEGDYSLALQFLEKVTNAPDVIMKWSVDIKGIAYLFLGDVDNAIQQFNLALHRCKGDDVAKSWLSWIYSGQKYPFVDCTSYRNEKKSRELFEELHEADAIYSSHYLLARYYNEGIGGLMDKEKALKVVIRCLEKHTDNTNNRFFHIVRAQRSSYIKEFLCSCEDFQSREDIPYHIVLMQQICKDNKRLLDHINASPDGELYFEAYEHYKNTTI